MCITLKCCNHFNKLSKSFLNVDIYFSHSLVKAVGYNKNPIPSFEDELLIIPEFDNIRNKYRQCLLSYK